MAAKYTSKPDPNLSSCSPAVSRLLFELAVPELVAAVAQALSDCARANDELLDGEKQNKSISTRFNAKVPPPISLEAYLKRLMQLTPYPLDVLLLAVVYINRVTHLKAPPSSKHQFSPLFPSCRSKRSTAQEGSAGPSPPLTRYTAHRLMLAALVVAAAYSSDHFIARNRTAKVAGVSMKEVHELEVEMFGQLSHDCVVHSGELDSVCRAIWGFTEEGKWELAELQQAAQKEDTPASDDARIAPPFCYTPKHLSGDFSGLSLSPRAPPRVACLVHGDDATPTPPLSEGESESSYFSSSSLGTDEDQSPSRTAQAGSEQNAKKATSSSRTVTPTLARTVAATGSYV